MTPESHRKICDLYHSASELATAERTAFLDEACGGDEALRREVESLLAARDRAGDYFATPAMDVAAGLLADENYQSLAGQSLSHYQVLSLIGAGGMGEVTWPKTRGSGVRSRSNCCRGGPHKTQTARAVSSARRAPRQVSTTRTSSRSSRSGR